MLISVLALDGVFDTGFTATLDALVAADNLSALVDGGAHRFDVSIVGLRKRVKTALGLTIPVQSVASAPKPDWVIMPALKATTVDQLLPALERRDVIEAKAQLSAWHDEGVLIATSCIGTFLLAEIGLLDQREATTSWLLSPLFRERYPQVRLDESRMLVPTDIGVTAGAAMGHLDLALWLIRKTSPELAALVSRYLLADLRSMQAPYIIRDHLTHSDTLILKFEQWTRKRLKIGFSLPDAAEALSTTVRTLQRRCQTVLGRSPVEYIQDLRIERAQSLLHGSGLDVEAIAKEVGYMDATTLRTLLRERLGRGVRELRNELR